MKNKTVILTLLTLFSIASQAQEHSDLKEEDLYNGHLFTNPMIDTHVGTWKSDDGRYTFSATKSIYDIKIQRLNHSTEVLALKLIKAKGDFDLLDKIINYTINFVTVGNSYARTSFKDPITLTEGFITLRKQDDNTLTVSISHQWSGENQKGFFFPQRMVLHRVK